MLRFVCRCRIAWTISAVSGAFRNVSWADQKNVWRSRRKKLLKYSQHALLGFFLGNGISDELRCQLPEELMNLMKNSHSFANERQPTIPLQFHQLLREKFSTFSNFFVHIFIVKQMHEFTRTKILFGNDSWLEKAHIANISSNFSIKTWMMIFSFSSFFCSKCPYDICYFLASLGPLLCAIVHPSLLLHRKSITVIY